MYSWECIERPLVSEACWFIEMRWMNSLSSSLWMTSETKIAKLDITLGNRPNFLRMECDFSKLPEVQMLTEDYWRHPGFARWNSRQKSVDVRPSCAHFGPRPNQFCSQGHLTRSSREMQSLPPFPLSLWTSKENVLLRYCWWVKHFKLFATCRG